MILINLSNKIFENDVYPLVKAFYAQETIKVIEVIDNPPRSGEESGLPDTNPKIRIDLTFADQKVSIRILEPEKLEQLTQESSLIKDGIPYKEVQMEELDTVSYEKEKANYKNAMKRLLYRMLSQRTGQVLPWGIMTGIRPTKLVYDMISKKKTEVEIDQHMKEEFLCSEEKIQMSIRIASREHTLLQDMDYQKGYSLYIGIPFCPTTCLYCSFTSYPLERFAPMVGDYLKALEKEINYGASCIPDKKLTTVYLGGGTPTTLSAEQLSWLLGLIRDKFDFTYVKEFCVEAGRPDSITREKLEVLKRWGVDRISINPQTMQQRTLDLIGRKHTVEQINEAFHLARETGHENINMDLIIGLPGENLSDVQDTLKQIEKLSPDSITVHTLALKRAARLNIEKENYRDLKATDVKEMLQETIEFSEKQGYLPYYLYRQKNMADNLENIGYAKFGKEGLYNILIMEEQQTILALGAGAMSKFVFHEENRIERVDNVKSITDYINRIDEMIQRKVDFLNHSL